MVHRYQRSRAALFALLAISSSGFSPAQQKSACNVPTSQFSIVASGRRPSSCLTQLSASEQILDAPSSTSGANLQSIDADVLHELNECTSGTAARKVLEKALLSSSSSNDDETPSGRLYGSLFIPRGASDRSLSDADLAIQTGIRNSKYSVMELIELNGDRDADRAALSLICVTVGSTISALAANQNLPGPDILRFIVVWLLSFAPLAFVGTGIAAPAELQAVLVRIQREVLPTYRRRMLQHEAGHFLIGHLLGLPIKGYRANAVKNAVEFYPLSDEDVGLDRAQMLGFDKAWGDENGYAEAPESGDQPYFSDGGKGERAMQDQSVFREDKDYANNPFLKLPSQNDPKQAWPYRGFDEETLDQLAVISAAGVCAEILAFGNAEGGYADLSQLRQLFNAAEPKLDEKAMENRIRYSLGYGISQLRRHLGALDALVEVMERDGSVAECVLAIESCENVSGATVMGDYERIRREKIRSDGVGLIERTLLGGGKNADTEDNGVVYGKGGGHRKKRFVLTGDDPLYAAGAAALAFFLWATSGGLSLH